MNRKGITPVVAIVLLLMMTVAAAGGAYAWFSGILHGAMIKPIEVSFIEQVCDTSHGWVNSTMINDGDQIEVGGGGTYFVKDTAGRIIKTKNLSVHALDGPDNNGIWEAGERNSVDLAGLNIKSQSKYQLELKIKGYGKTNIRTACTGRYVS